MSNEYIDPEKYRKFDEKTRKIVSNLKRIFNESKKLMKPKPQHDGGTVYIQYCKYCNKDVWVETYSIGNPEDPNKLYTDCVLCKKTLW